MQPAQPSVRGGNLIFDGLPHPCSRRAFFCLIVTALLAFFSSAANAAVTIQGPTAVCVGGTNLFVATSDSSPIAYSWTIGTNNSAAATIIGETTNDVVAVVATVSGSFDLECAVDDAEVIEVGSTNVVAADPVESTPLTNQVACPGDVVLFSTTVTGGTNYTIVWRKDGDLLPGETDTTLTLTNVSDVHTGLYCVEIVGECNAITNCATLDLTQPAIVTGPSNLVVECLGDVPPPDTNSVITTNAVEVFFIDDASVTNDCQIDITRTYGALNSCGVTSTCSQVITVLDTTPPILTGTTNLVFEFGTAWNFQPPAVFDNCESNSLVLIVTSTVTNPLCGGTYEAMRTWTAMDACSNAASFTQTVTIVDTTPPVIVCPSNFTVECDTPWSFGTPVAADKQLGKTIVYDNTVNDLNFRLDLNGYEAGNEIVLASEMNYLQGFSYEFWTTNLTGSSYYEGTNVTVRLRMYANDGTEFNGYPTPGTLIYDSGEFWLGQYTMARATVNYDEYDLWLYAEQPMTGPMPTNFTWTVQFSGLGTNDQAGVDLYSTPVIGYAYGDFWLRTDTGWELRTNGTVATDFAAQAWASTNTVTIVELSTVTNSVATNAYAVTRTWVATDACGNTNLCSQTVTVQDTTAPEIVGLPYKTVGLTNTWSFEEPVASDNCGPATLTILNTTTNPTCGAAFDAVRIWEALDDSGNSTTFTQVVAVIDDIPPVLTGTNNLVYEFGETWDFLTPVATDIGDGTNVTLVVSDNSTNSLCGNTYEATRIWTAIDACGNSNSFAQTVTLIDTTPPLLSGQTNLTFEFGDVWDFAPPTVTDIADGTNLDLIITSTETNPLCGNTYEAIQTWSATDSCSNSASFTQVVTLLDTTPPSFVGVTNRVIECGEVWDYEPPAVSDIADGTNLVLIVSSTSTNPLCGATFEATQTWSVTDSCSNSASFSQTVTIVDTTPPVLIPGTNRFVECGEAWDFDAPTATDVCGDTNVTISILGTITNALVGETYAATRTWVAEDACGNTNSGSQTITIIDTTPPQIFCSSNIVVECEGDFGTVVEFSVTAFDGCDTNVDLVITPPSGTAFALGTNTVVCVATDDSGNTNTCSFLVTVIDTTPPDITCPPNLIVSETPRDSGGSVVTFDPPTVVDICDSIPQLIADPPSGSVFPVGTNTVTWTAIDSSGNSNSCTFTIRVIPYRLFVVYNTDDSGPGSLRQAILDGNDAPDENLILFQLPGSGPFVINLESPLPPITSPTIVDGWSQIGSNTAPIVEVVGQSNTFEGLVIQSGPSQVRGLALHGFSTAILIDGAGTNIIQGNYIGLDVTGTNAPGNGYDGIYVNSSSNRIGGTLPGTGNLISGNGGNGIHLTSLAASNNVIQGNAIGTAYDGVLALPNSLNGIFLTNGASMTVIGGTVGNSGNIIAYSGEAGVALDSSAGTGNSILGNSIFDNLGLGIDLESNGITPNDADDTDAGPNGLQNFPILSDARSVSGTTTIEGQLISHPNTSYRIEFYLNDYADPSTNGEGRTYIGSKQVNVNGSGTESFSVSFLLTAVYTQFISAIATDPDGNSSEFSPVVQVRTPPIIEMQPQGTNANTGESVTFCAQVSGTPPIEYQWRLNGVNIPGATNSCYTIPSAELDDGGTYSVVVKNDLAALASSTASLILGGTNILFLPGGDDFVDAVSIAEINGGTNGTVVANNSAASMEPFEPLHAGKFGGRSVWYAWRTPEGSKGIATFRTSGSTFDTLLAVYKGTSVSNLTEIASSEDDARFYSSEVRFNAFYHSPSNSWYFIAVDAFGGDGGEFVLTWDEEKTSHMLPVILIQPLSRTVPLGGGITFSNIAVPQCASGHLDCNNLTHWEPNGNKKEKLTYQWYLNGLAIPGATNYSYTISSVQPEHVGDYRVRIFTPWQYLDSKIAVLQINQTGNTSQQSQAVDKFQDLAFTPPIFIGGFFETEESSPPSEGGFAVAAAATTVARGYTGTQIFNTTGSATGPGETICGVIGGSSEWLTLVAEATGTLFLNTDGSTYDTVIAVFQRNPTNSAALIQLACDNNSGMDGKDSSVVMPVNAGSTNYVLVDGVNGAVGVLQLNYSLATTTILKMNGRTPAGANIIQVNGRPELNFTLQGSTNLKNWTNLVTTNAPTGVLDYTDSSSIGVPGRYYRALILP